MVNVTRSSHYGRTDCSIYYLTRKGTHTMNTLPLVCVECGRIFQDKEVEEVTKDGQKVKRIITADLQAYRHTSGEEADALQKGAGVPGHSNVPKKHMVFPVSKEAWERGHYEGWPTTRFKK